MSSGELLGAPGGSDELLGAPVSSVSIEFRSVPSTNSTDRDKSQRSSSYYGSQFTRDNLLADLNDSHKRILSLVFREEQGDLMAQCAFVDKTDQELVGVLSVEYYNLTSNHVDVDTFLRRLCEKTESYDMILIRRTSIASHQKNILEEIGNCIIHDVVDNTIGPINSSNANTSVAAESTCSTVEN